MNRGTHLVIFVGPPGSGKGSLSQLCTRKLGWTQLSTGSLCRKHIAEKTEIGKEIDFSIRYGKLIADELIVSMVKEWLENNIEQQRTVILDGFPRTITQAEYLQVVILEKLPQCRLSIIKLAVSDKVITERLLGRYTCANNNCQAIYSIHAHSAMVPKKPNVCDVCEYKLIRREDDDEAVVCDRLSSYHKYEHGLIEFYKRIGKKIKEINVEKPINRVFEDFTSLIVENE
ncbi:MAG: nucleoside monophosphate kinase [Candidatus Babeliales bacterium]